MFLDNTLIGKFRRVVNSNHYFVLNQYRNQHGKNLWNIICSCMDWIEVAIDGIPYIQYEHKNPNVASLNLMQLICSMDLVKESVHQLFRVFKLEYPFKKDNSIFLKQKSDDEYFKHIRAVFGVHPVNLKGQDGNRYYASWSTPRLEGDFATLVYSNKVGVKDQIYSIRIEELFQYTNKRYLLLREVMKKIEHDFLSHQHKLKATEIKRPQSTIDHLKILKNENLERYGEGEAYWHEIDEMQRLYSINISSSFNPSVQEMIEKYLGALLMVISEIHQNLQNMSIEELSTYEVLNPFDNLAYSYEKEKLLVYLHSPEPDYNTRISGEMGLQLMVEKGELPEIALEYNRDELLIFLNAWQWSKN
ncbi:hypothetical protein QGM71_12295 [Virgibacillus sp. C22-A2]|uniref:Uncharacterized protein n=1 Tax=Virgibacillus tibetensis TaxID=3042313 RepID=A0ABU6KG26_9BACI|nr:hypothetical protein [Virgibacillus sp. C22-A2]